METVHEPFSAQSKPSLHNLCMGKNSKKSGDSVAMLCGDRIRACRKAENDMTQAALAAATGWNDEKPAKSSLSPSRIANFEQGTRRVGVEEAEILARVFTKYPAAYFLGVVDEREASMLLIMRTESNSLPKAV